MRPLWVGSLVDPGAGPMGRPGRGGGGVAHSFEWVTDVAIGEAGEIVLLALPGLTHSCHVLDMSNVTSPQ